MVQGSLAGAADVVVFLPPAGSVTSPYLPIGARLPPALPALHCEVPGRGRLGHDEAPASVTAAVDRWWADLAALVPGGRLHLFGHSLGALFAYELTARVETGSRHEIASLSVSGAREPGSAARTLVATAFEALRREQPASDQKGDAEGAWLTADLRMRREHRIAQESVHAPLALFCGTSDPFARPAEMEAWKRFTSGPFLGTFTFPGGHDYYLSGQETTTAAALARVVARARDARRAPASRTQPETENTGVGHDG